MSNSQFNDTELLKLLSQDDAVALQEIYKRHAKFMFNFAYKIFKNRPICEDIVQKIFIDLWTRRRESSIINLKPYLLQSVRFQVLKEVRKDISFEQLALLNTLDSSGDVSEQLEYKELELELKNNIDRLAPRCREVFIMSRYDNMTNKEISSELDISVQAVKNHIGKALAFLRKKFEVIN